QRDRDTDELPATTKLCDQIRGSIRECQARFLFFVRVSRNTRAQQFVRSSQSISQRAQQLECDIRITSDERKKRIARKNCKLCIFDDSGVSRSLSPVNDCHLAEEVALREFCEGHFLIVVVADTDKHAAFLDQVHRVALVALLEETCVLRHLFVGKQAAELRCRFVIERGKQRHRTKRLERHLSSRLRHGNPPIFEPRIYADKR